jgi:hypothetical protein
MLSLKNARCGPISAAEDRSLSTQSDFKQIKNWLDGFFSGTTDILEEQTFQNGLNFINAKKNVHGQRECSVSLNDDVFLVRECHVPHNASLANGETYPDIFVLNTRTEESTTINSMSFSGLQKQILRVYIAEQHRHGIADFDLQMFNLSELAEMDLSDFDFRGARLSKENDEAIAKRGGKLLGNTSAQKPAIHFDDFSSAKKAVNQLHRQLHHQLHHSTGQLIIAGHSFMVDWKNGHDAKVRANNFRQLYVASKLQQLLRHTAVKEQAIACMTHADLPAALQRLNSEHWERIGRAVLQDTQNSIGEQFKAILEKQFYSGIYSSASSHLNYAFSHHSPEVRQKEWHSLVKQVQENPNWKPEGIKYAQGAHVQGQVDTPENIQQAKIFLDYYKATVRSRIQFVADYAGQGLLKDIASTIDAFIDAECDHDRLFSPVKRFKVFSEDIHVGRSDSAVIYLSVPLRDPQVQKLAEYLDRAIGNRMASINIIGASNIGTTKVQGINIPNSTLQIKWIGREANSHGLLVSDVLASAYQLAYTEAIQIHESREQIDVNQFNQRAQFHAAKIWYQLGLSNG